MTMYGGWTKWDQKPNDWVTAEHTSNWNERSLDRVIEYIPTRLLIREHQHRTMICSVSHHMRKCSGPMYKELKRRYDKDGDYTLACILDYMEMNPDTSGMSIMMLLWDFTGEDPAKDAYEAVGDTGFAAFNVDDCYRAWLEWGSAKGLLQ